MNAIHQGIHTRNRVIEHVEHTLTAHEPGIVRGTVLHAVALDTERPCLPVQGTTFRERVHQHRRGTQGPVHLLGHSTTVSEVTGRLYIFPLTEADMNMA